MRTHRGRLRDQSGASLVLVLISLVGLLSAGAVAVDVGVMMTARADAQRAADAMALAGAGALVGNGPDADPRLAVEEIAAENLIAGHVIGPGDLAIEVDPAGAIVRVVLTAPPPPTFFTGVLGVQAGGVSASAAAEATAAPVTTCAKPWSLPDPLLTGGGGLPELPGGASKGSGGNGGGNGQGDLRYGQQVVMHGGGSGPIAWDVPIGEGHSGSCSYTGNGSINSGPTLRANICNCNNTSVVAGEEYSLLNGNKNGPMNQGIAALLEQDAGAVWDPVRGAVIGSQSADWRRGPRVVTIPLHDPASVGGGTVSFTRFVRVFVEGEIGGALAGRYVGGVRTLRLIE